MAEFSIVGSGALLCSGKCSYCSATSVQDVDFKKKGVKKEDFGKVVWDWDAVKKIFDTNPIVQEHLKNGKVLTLNWWAAEPLDFYKDADAYFKWINATYPKLRFQAFISTNGIPLARKNVQEWIYEANKKWRLQLQLSHDGVGQYVRTRTFDPLYDPRTKDFIVKLARDGILNMVNTTLNNYNYSPIANMNYWNKWRFDNHIEKKDILIKLNHNNDSEYTGDYKLTGEHLRAYMHEMEILMQQAYIADNNDPVWHPYAGYLRNQMKRWQPFRQYGGCAGFSRGERDWTWCINTKGEYVFCQLCNDPKDNPNPMVEQGPNCEGCEFEHYDECHGCPDMVFAENCEYKKEYMRLVLRMKQYCFLIDNFMKERDRLYLQLKNNNNQCNCNNNNQCNCNKPNPELTGNMCNNGNGQNTGMCNACIGNNFNVWSKAREKQGDLE